MQQLPTTTPLFLQPKPIKPEKRVLTKVGRGCCKSAWPRVLHSERMLLTILAFPAFLCLQEELEEVKFAYEQLDAGEGLTPKQVKVALRAMVSAC
jgi:hypothetical protein